MNLPTFVARTFVFCLLFSALQTRAQQAVQYEQLSFEAAMAKAQKEKKIIFVDVQRDKPSEFDAQVAANVFPTDSIASFFKKHCIAIKINMHTEEGKKFAPRLAMLMYPAYVFYAGTGDQLEYTNAAVVAKDPGVLMAKARTSLAVDQQKTANSRSISFTKDSWAALLAKAKKENKLIFLDAHTEWCRPCIMMAKNVFTLNNVADFYNKNFINTEMDMEKGEGPALAKKYAIRAYPSFLFIDGDGKLVSRDGGYQEADAFIKAGQTALDKKVKPAGEAGFVMPVALTLPSKGSKATTTNLPAPKEQPSAIQFSAKNWEGILAEARATGKLIFMDAHTTWCGPCKTMRANVFTQEKVGAFFNRNFVSAYTDMEKGEGIELRKKYDVRFYPTFLFIDGKGEVVHRIVGSCSTEEFIQHGLDALSPVNNLNTLRKEYPSKTQDAAFIQRYLRALGNAYDKDEADKVASDYLQSIRPDSWLERENYQLIREYIKDASSPVFAYLLKNRARFGALYGEEEVDAAIYSTLLSWPAGYVTYPANEAPVFDKKGFDTFVNLVRSADFDKKEEVISRAKLTVSLPLRDWATYTDVVNNMIASGQIMLTRTGADQLFLYTMNAQRFADGNKEALIQASKWTEQMLEIKDLPLGRKLEVMGLYADLLEATDRKKKAVAVRKQIAKEKPAANAQNVNKMQMLMIK